MSDRPGITSELLMAMGVNRQYTMSGDEVMRTYIVGRDEFIRLCDTIDSVHAALEAENERLRDRDGWIELPKDANGVPIRVGDVMEFSYFDIEHPVVRTVEGIGKDVFFGWCGERGYQQHDAKRYRHHHHDTWERIEDDATMPPGDYVDKRMTVAHGTIETVDEAFEAMACDLVARCKALAGDAE